MNTPIDKFEFIETDTAGETNGATYFYTIAELRTRLSLQWPEKADQIRFAHLIAIAVSAPNHPVDLTLHRDVEALHEQTHLTWSARLYYRP